MRDLIALAIVAVGCITSLTVTYMAMGHDGIALNAAFGAIVAIIAAVLGYLTGRQKNSQTRDNVSLDDRKE